MESPAADSGAPAAAPRRPLVESGESPLTDRPPALPRAAGQRWRPLLAWAVLLIGGLLLAAVVAPFGYSALLELLPAADWPFSRVFNRTAMAIAAVLLFLLRRPLGWSALPALFAERTRGRKLLGVVAGFAAALLGVAFAVATAWILGRLGPAVAPYSFFEERTATAFLGGLAVGGIEETVFRGLMLVSLTAAVGFPAAAIASSGAYSLVHLLVSDPTLKPEGFSLEDGFAYLVHAVGRQLEPATVLPLSGIFLCGLVAAFVVRRSGTLYLAIGLHAGWAFAFQVLRHATRPLVEIPGHSYLATHHYLVGTLWAWAGVIVAGLLALAWVRFERASKW